MSIETQLFEGKLIRLTPIDHEKDPPVGRRWDLILMGILREEWLGQDHS